MEREQARESVRKRRGRRRLRILASLGAVAIVAVVIVSLLTLTGGGAPSVVGLTVDQAKTLAAEAGMEVSIAALLPTFNQQAGIVREQDPAPGGKADDDVLRLTVTREPSPVVVSEVKDYDPEGDDTENPGKLGSLVDGNEATVWSTELYRSSAFGDLKAGVGLNFTLEEGATIVEIISSVEGWKGQLLQPISSGSTAKVATLDGQSTQIIALGEPLTAGRIWLTELAQLTDDRWGVELSEIRFYK
ncbi:MAG: hypothetical protein A2133_06515 [Actinobacteria bacterium RBG_16_64_13]|nr:MAG: hypothetical protein A2133_06515 [Actinobacteria bacterium RBG_16_64_13]